MNLETILIDRKRRCITHGKRHDRNNVEKVAFISRRAELCSSVDYADQFDRAETVWQMNREDRNRKQNDSRNTCERNEGASQESDANGEFGHDCEPRSEERR